MPQGQGTVKSKGFLRDQRAAHGLFLVGTEAWYINKDGICISVLVLSDKLCPEPEVSFFYQIYGRQTQESSLHSSLSLRTIGDYTVEFLPVNELTMEVTGSRSSDRLPHIQNPSVSSLLCKISWNAPVSRALLLEFQYRARERECLSWSIGQS